jgi:serine/threonine protein kinase
VLIFRNVRHLARFGGRQSPLPRETQDGEEKVPDTHPLQPGDPVRLGNYRLIGRLGKGAQGIVFKGTGPDGTPVAIKLLNTRLDRPGIDAERFMREVAAARRVAPFCTAQVLDASMDGDLPYIVSELVEGVSLQRIVQTDGPRGGGALYRLAVGTVTALAAIHRAGIVHRDFKPSNVMLGPDGPRVIDFGIARALDSAATISSGVVGTPAYMSPEQISGERVGPPSDMFSWALTMTFAATGRPAFGQDSLPAVIYRVMNQQPDLSALPGDLRPIVAACLSKRAEERPSAADTLFALLENQGAPPPRDADVALTTGSQVAAEETPPPATRPPSPPRGTPVSTGWTSPSGAVDPTPGLRQPPHPPASGRPPHASAPGQSPYGPVTGQPPHSPAPGLPYGSASGRSPYAPQARPVAGHFDNDAFFKETEPEEKRAEGARRRRVLVVGGAVLVALVLAGAVLFLMPTAFDGHPEAAKATTSVAPVPTTNAPVPPTSTSTATGVTASATVPPTPSGTPTSPLVKPDDPPPALAGQDGKALAGHRRAVQSVSAVTIGGRQLMLSGGQDGTLRLWDAAKRRTVAKLRGHGSEVYAVACYSTGKTPMAVTGGYDHTVRLWNLKTRKGRVLGYHPIAVFAVAVAKVKGKWIAVTGDGDGTLRVWDLKKRRQIGSIRAHRKDINWLAVGRVGKRPVVVTASEDRTLRVWDLNRRKAYGKAYKGHAKPVFSVAFGQVNGAAVVASGGKDKRIRIWNAKTGATIGKPMSGHTSNVYSLAFGRFGGRVILASGSTDGTIRLWDPATRKALGKPLKAHKGGVYSVSFVTVSGKVAVVSAGKDKKIKFWRLESVVPGS